MTYTVPNVQWKTPDDGQKNCPKYVEILDKKIWEINESVDFIKNKLASIFHQSLNT
jgi:uncharacterized protein YlaN (UPF0358 family)